MMYNQVPTESDYVAFDIETTGLSASDEVTCFATGDLCSQYICGQDETTDESTLLSILSRVMDNIKDKNLILVTFNGGTKFNPGFDLAILRSRYIKLGITGDWPFRNIRHIDIYPLVKTVLNTRMQVTPTLDNLKVDELKALCNDNGIKPPRLKGDLIKSLSEIPNITDSIPPIEKEINGLKPVYEFFSGDVEENPDPIKSWDTWKLTHDQEHLDALWAYNKRDVYKTMWVFDILKKIIPSNYMISEVL